MSEYIEKWLDQNVWDGDKLSSRKNVGHSAIAHKASFCPHDLYKLVTELVESRENNLEKENAELRANWEEIKTQLAFSVENYEEYEIDIYMQILKEMKKIEGGKG